MSSEPKQPAAIAIFLKLAMWEFPIYLVLLGFMAYLGFR